MCTLALEWLLPSSFFSVCIYNCFIPCGILWVHIKHPCAPLGFYNSINNYCKWQCTTCIRVYYSPEFLRTILRNVSGSINSVGYLTEVVESTHSPIIYYAASTEKFLDGGHLLHFVKKCCPKDHFWTVSNMVSHKRDMWCINWRKKKYGNYLNLPARILKAC